MSGEDDLEKLKDWGAGRPASDLAARLYRQEPTFRRATNLETLAVTQLTEAAYAPWTAHLGAPPLPVIEDYAPRIARGEVWLLERDGTLLGLLVLESAADHTMIFSIAVTPEHQGRRYGIAILTFAEEQTRLMGLAEIRLYTNARMERNIALYLAHGYVETGHRPNPRRPGWTIIDMAKRLG